MRKQTCHCGHDIATHHEREGACLGRGCNDPSADWNVTSVTNPCPRFRDSSQPDTFRAPPTRPLHADWCLCFGCKAWRAHKTSKELS